MTAHLLALDNMANAWLSLANQGLQIELGNEDDVLKQIGTLDCNNNDSTVSSDDVGSTWFRLDVFGICLSLFSLSFISYAILTDKRVRGHPNNIIALICLCDAYTYS